ncbi:SAM-dependent methyltransferase [Nonomuraea typhae]|uniref:SAM-dependent methyltransferase n=1 Tax=Nonomuraea typhae TaxID=2603600 RepID=A0ABW7Z5C1_9ACTN
MSLRFHEIAESRHRILNPFTDDKLDLLGELCQPPPGTRHLDLACGKGELLGRWAATYGSHGTGVDISEVFIAAARTRAAELNVTDTLTFVTADAATYAKQAEPRSYDIVSCIGATWIGGGLSGTLDLMRPLLRPNGLILVGEVFWNSTPPPEAITALGLDDHTCLSLAQTAATMDEAGFDLLDMVLASPDSWDRYTASQWWTLSDWLRDNPHDPDAPAVHDALRQWRTSHLEYGRQYLGWGVFILRPAIPLPTP